MMMLRESGLAKVPKRLTNNGQHMQSSISTRRVFSKIIVVVIRVSFFKKEKRTFKANREI